MLACRLDNLIYHARQPGQVLGVLDWELSTLGHPLADLAFTCMAYRLRSSALPQGAPSLPDPLPAGEVSLVPSRNSRAQTRGAMGGQLVQHGMQWGCLAQACLQTPALQLRLDKAGQCWGLWPAPCDHIQSPQPQSCTAALPGV